MTDQFRNDIFLQKLLHGLCSCSILGGAIQKIERFDESYHRHQVLSLFNLVPIALER